MVAEQERVRRRLPSMSPPQRTSAGSRRADAASRRLASPRTQAFFMMRGGNAAELRGCVAAAGGVPERPLANNASLRRADAAMFESPEARGQAPMHDGAAAEEEDPDVAFARALMARAATRALSLAACSPRPRPRDAGGGGARLERAHACDGGPASSGRCARAMPQQAVQQALTRSALPPQTLPSWRAWAWTRRMRSRAPSTSTA